MNPYEPPASAVGVDTGEHVAREPPSAVLTACKAQMKWQIAVGVLFASFAALIPWLGFEVREYMIVVGRYEATMATAEPMGYLIGCCLMGAFALVVSLAS